LQALQNFNKLQKAAVDLKENPVINVSKDENSVYKIVVDNFLNKEPPPKSDHKNDTVPSKTTQKLPIKQNKNIKELNWNESDVVSWCKEKGIHPNIEHHISPCTGLLLYEFFLIKNESPDFFYRSLAINKNNTKPVMIRDLAIFSLELKKIFNS